MDSSVPLERPGVCVCVAGSLSVTPLQRHTEGSASRSNRSAGATVQIYIDWEHCPQALQYSSPPLSPLLCLPSPLLPPPINSGELFPIFLTVHPGQLLATINNNMPFFQSNKFDYKIIIGYGGGGGGWMDGWMDG